MLSLRRAIFKNSKALRVSFQPIYRSYTTNNDVFYTKDHEWVRREGDIGIIGITDHAQDALGDITHFSFEVAVGDTVKKQDILGAVESIKTVSDIYSPLDGEVVELNEELTDDQKVTLINESPEDKAWMIKIKVSNWDTSELMSREEYDQYVAENQ